MAAHQEEVRKLPGFDVPCHRNSIMAKSLTDGEIVNGKKHGYWVTYYANGFKRSEGGYIEGKKKGFGSSTIKMETRQVKPPFAMARTKATM